MLAFRPIQSTLFGRTWNTASKPLIDIDVFDVVFISVMVDVQRESGGFNGFTKEPSYALED